MLVFTSEEVWKYLPRGASAQPSVHMASFPSPEPFERAFDDAHTREWDRLLAVREEVLKALEPLRAAKKISAGLEARVTLDAKGDLAALLRKHAAILPAFFIVSQVEIASRQSRRQAAPQVLPTTRCGSTSSAPTAKSASAAGTIRRTSAKAPITRHCASAVSPQWMKSSVAEAVWRGAPVPDASGLTPRLASDRSRHGRSNCWTKRASMPSRISLKPDRAAS